MLSEIPDIAKSIVQFSEALAQRETVRSNVLEIKPMPLVLRGVTAGLVQAVCTLISQNGSFGKWALQHNTKALLQWVQRTAKLPDGDGTSLCELVSSKLNTYNLETLWYDIFYPLDSCRPKKFMSYAWDYPVIYMWRLWEYGWVEVDDALWIDVFAVNQLNKEKQSCDLETLKDVIKEIGHTILVLDEKAYALTRCWCIFEVFHTIQSGSEFELAFMNNVQEGERLGFVCDYILMLLAYVGRFDNLDTRNAVATNEADRRSIFSSIEKSIGFERVNVVVRDGIRKAAGIALKRGFKKFSMRGLTEKELIDWGTLVQKVGINWFTTADGLLDWTSFEFQHVFDAIQSCFWAPVGGAVKTKLERKEIYSNCAEDCERSVLPSQQFIPMSSSVSALFKVYVGTKDTTGLETILSIRRITFILDKFLASPKDIRTVPEYPSKYKLGLWRNKTCCLRTTEERAPWSFDSNEHKFGLSEERASWSSDYNEHKFGFERFSIGSILGAKPPSDSDGPPTAPDFQILLAD